MIKAIFWNIRYINMKQAFNRLKMLNRHHKYFITALMEPFESRWELQGYKRKVKINLAGANVSNKIWFFVKDGVEVETISDTNKKITTKATFLKRSKTNIDNYGICQIYKKGEDSFMERHI